ncbi:MAG: zinc ABC transporter substrate-binding protein [Ruminococcaceae bacterium]|nr:zinc ABC transporter substrate-binding protein [Oscillospiraceae bacterium]
MKKIVSVFLCLVLLIGSIILASCSDEQNGKKNAEIKIVTTIFPIYDWVKNITEGVDGVEVSMLINSGADLHSFQPSADDIISIQTSDVFIYVGGESDEWAEDATENSQNEKQRTLNLLELLGDSAKEEELVEGMQGEEEEDEEGEEEAEYDEHIWLSLKNADELVEEITEAICEVDSKNSDAYKANAKAYEEKLEALDDEYESCVSSAKTKTLLFGDRFPFRYLTDDYDIDYYAAFIGCSAETEASFETVSFLAKKLDELSLKYVITLEGTEHKLAETIINSSKSKNAKILTMNSMQSITADDLKNNISYLGIMQENLETLKTALN